MYCTLRVCILLLIAATLLSFGVTSSHSACWAVSVVEGSKAICLDGRQFGSHSQDDGNDVDDDDDDDDDAALSDEERQQLQVAQRFLGVLEKNPRYGTAMDRVYGHHVEFGSLDSFVRSLRQKAEERQDGTDWMLLGMFEAQRGQDAAAVDAFKVAEPIRANDGLASYYLAQALLRIGEPLAAVAALERAIDRKPARADLLEIFQTLGRVHQRAQRVEEAMTVWQRLEVLFPDDPRVLEQIAITLAEEGANEAALERYQKLASLTKDDYRRVMYEIAAAELTIKLKKRDDGIAQFERVLENLNPDSWLHRDVRRRIENVFVRSADQDGLVAYYERWLTGHPDDVEAMTRLARYLSESARVPEAAQWMEKALTLAPSRSDFRRAFISQLVENQKITEALEQYPKLVKSAPGNSDYLRDWGKLVLRERNKPESERQAEAIRIWTQIIEIRPDDALTVSQVADLFRQNKISDEAEKLYRRATELAPNDPQYREYLGEFLFLKGDTQEAQAVWAAIAEGDRRTVTNVARLSEIYNNFGLFELATQEIAAAVNMDPKDFSLQIRAADLFIRAGKDIDSMAAVEQASLLAGNDEQRELATQQRIEILQATDRLEEVTDELWVTLKQTPPTEIGQWILLARFLQAQQRWAEADQAIDQALKLQPQSAPALTLAARLAEAGGNFARAAEMYRNLVTADRRSRGEHLMNVSRLEFQLGHSDAALAAGAELIASAPGNTEHYEFYAQTCFRLGRTEDGLEALRKAVRIDPNQPHLMMALATALSDQLRTEESIELYWRAFEKSEEIADKILLTTKLADLYQVTNQVEQLMQRLERERREEEKRREMTICLAQAWQTLGDFGAARTELEGLLSEDSRDTTLLNQLAKLCQANGDMEAAISYQRQLAAVAPGEETESPLANMLFASGQVDEARDILVKLTLEEQDPLRQLRSLDGLLRQENFEAAIAVLEPLLAQNREDWELLYREGACWASLGKSAEATNRFQRLLAIKKPLDSLGRVAEARLKQAQAKAKSDRLRGTLAPPPSPPTVAASLRKYYEIRQATGLESEQRYYAPNQSPPRWTPESFGDARMAGWGWLLRLEQDAKFATNDRSTANANANEAVVTEETVEPSNAESNPSLTDSVLATAMAEAASQDQIYDGLYVTTLNLDFSRRFRLATRLLEGGGRDGQNFYLEALTARHQSNDRYANVSNSVKKPLDEAELQQLRNLYQSLKAAAEAEKSSEVFLGGQIIYAADGQAYVFIGDRYVPISGLHDGSRARGVLIEELKLAGEQAEAEALAKEWMSSVNTASELASAMNWVITEKRFDEMPLYFERWKTATLQEIRQTTQQNTSGAAGQRSSNVSRLAAVISYVQQWMVELRKAEEYATIIDVLDKCLDITEAETIKRQQLAATRKGSQQQVSTSSYTYIYSAAGVQNQQQVSVPMSRDFADFYAGVLLLQVNTFLKESDAENDLTERLRNRLATAQQSQNLDQERAARTYLANYLWLVDEKEEAVEEFSKVVALYPNDMTLQFALARLLLSRNDFEDALNVVQAIPAMDQKVLQQRELLALSLAERTGNRERAVEAAERLFGMRLPAPTQVQLVQSLQRLGLNQQADAMLARSQRAASNQLSSMSSLMTLYQGQRKHEEAQQLAHMILRRSTSPVVLSSRTAVNPRMRGRSSDDQYRSQAVQLLNQTGGLQRLIETLEAQLERSPDSLVATQQLIEFHELIGKNNVVLELLKKAAQARPDNHVVRYRLAAALAAASRHDEACDEHLAVLKLQPSWMLENLSEVRQTFSKAKREPELFAELDGVSLRNISQPHYVMSTAMSLIQAEATRDVGLRLFERCVDMYPSSRQYSNQLARNHQLWIVPNVFRILKRTLLPMPSEIAGNPWFGTDTSYSQDSSGYRLAIQDALTGLRGTEEMAELERELRDSVEKNPGWLGGQVLLGLLEDTLNQTEQSQKRFLDLATNPEAVKTMPGIVIIIVAMRLDANPETRDVAMDLLTKSSDNNSNLNSSVLISSSPVGQIVEVLIRNRRFEAAKSLLVKNISPPDLQHYDPASARLYRLQNSNWAAERFVMMEDYLAAARIYRATLSELVDSSTPIDSSNLQVAQTGLESAISRIGNIDSQQLFDFFFSSTQGSKPDLPLVRLDIVIADNKQTESKSVQSETFKLLHTILKKQNMETAFREHIASLQAQHGDDLSLAILQAALAVQQQAPDTSQLIAEVRRLAISQPLEAIPSERKPNSRQRRAAEHRLALWLLAASCLENSELQEVGDAIAELSLEAATRAGANYQSAVLFQWGDLLLKSNRRDEAEAKWTQLLDQLTQPPKKARGVPAQTTHFEKPQGSGVIYVSSWIEVEAIDDPIPPLTLSQFRLAMLVARRAAENGFPELSRRAVRDSVRGGLPIADPVIVDPNSPTSMVAMSSRSVGGAAAGGFQVSPITSEVIGAILKVSQLWAKHEAAPIDSYHALADLVFPPGRPDIQAFITTTDPWNMQFQSLADPLIELALKANANDDLRARIQQRRDDPRFAMSGDVLEFLLELKSGNRDVAGQVLKRIAEKQGSGSVSADRLLAYFAAANAFEFNELKEVAFPILDATLRLPGSTDPNSVELPSLNNRLSAAVLGYMKDQSGEAAVTDYYDGILASRTTYYSRFSGSDFGQQMQHQDLGAIANQAAQLGLFNVAFDFLGRISDMTVVSYGRVEIRNVVAFCAQRLRDLAPADRYTKWLEWTMPSTGRQDVRRAFGLTAPAIVPREFFTTPTAYDKQLHEPLVGNFIELVQAAKEADQMDDLEGRVRSLVANDTKHAEVLLALVLIEKGAVEEANELLTKLRDSFSDRLAEESRTSRVPATSGEADFATVLAALKRPELHAELEPQLPQLKQQYRTVAQGRLVQWFQWYLDRQRLSPENESAAISQWLQHWAPVPSYESSGHIQPQLVALDDTLLNLGGPEQSDVYFRLPLNGNFQVQMELGDSAEANWVGYGGSLISPSSSLATVSSLARHEYLSLRYPQRRSNPAFNQLQIDVEDGKVKYSLNGHFLYEENRSPTSPWLLFSVQGNSQSIVQNIQFSGSIEIPSSVPLVVEKSLEGWSCHYYTEIQPMRRQERASDPKQTVFGVSARPTTASTTPPTISWQAEDSQLVGAPLANVRSGQPSWIYYLRPLGHGDAFEYEFLYDQDHSILHPTIGRRAVLLSEDNVRVKWLASSSDSYLINTVADFVTPATAKSVPLIQGDWNRVRVELKERIVSVQLNGTQVWEQELEPEQSTRFGLYRTKEQSVQAKNLVLHGGWSQAMPSNDQLLALKQPYPEATLRNITSLNDEFGVAVRPVNVLRKARGMSDDDAWKYLLEWVVPSPTHQNFRLYYARHASDLRDLLPADATTDDNGLIEGAVLHSPAIELTRLAVKLSRVEELRQAIDQVKPKAETERRKQDVLRALLAIEIGEPEPIDQSLAKVWADVSQPYPKTGWVLDRYWDALLTWRAGQHPHALAKAREIAHQLVKYERDEKLASNVESFRSLVSMLWGQLEYMAVGDTSSQPNESLPNATVPNATLPTTQWTAVTASSLLNRYMFSQPSRWHLSPGSAQHYAGEIPTFLYFQSPLMGSFEVIADRSCGNHESMSVGWGQFDAIPQHDWRGLQVTRDLRTWTDIARVVGEAPETGIYQSRLVVDGSRVESWVNGVRLVSENLSAPQDPWLVVAARNATNAGRIVGLTIRGTPEIPSELKLSEQERLVGWRADRYGDLIGP
ncbi:MAG: DUF1583 domain-containing protein, partial [Pirellulaceae bacterium]|nr:DUF1583 domain-containing protein [Pirellulaceae bacterium]